MGSVRRMMARARERERDYILWGGRELRKGPTAWPATTAKLQQQALLKAPHRWAPNRKAGAPLRGQPKVRAKSGLHLRRSKSEPALVAGAPGQPEAHQEQPLPAPFVMRWQGRAPHVACCGHMAGWVEASQQKPSQALPRCFCRAGGVKARPAAVVCSTKPEVRNAGQSGSPGRST